ncbi:MAG: hypothetical protein ACK5RG_12235 [Cyclobacteriaceae bacterium]|jgi:hypothetical protein|nr:hypothetical protein [Flammeovirgaceae bacterium]
MGLIREPKGVDFVIKSRPLTKKEEELLSSYIREEKAKRNKKIISRKTAPKRIVPAKEKAMAKKA